MLTALRSECSFLAVTRRPNARRAVWSSRLVDASVELAPLPSQFPADPRAPEFAQRTRAYVQELARICEKHAIAMVIPASDVQVVAMGTHADLLAGLALDGPLPPASAAIEALDKLASLEAAARAGVPVPKTRPVGSLQEAEEAVAELGYPVVVKARFSTASVGTRVLRDSAKLAFAIDEVGRLPGGVIVQEYVAGGPERSVHMIIQSDGTPLLVWTLRKTRYAHSSLSVAIETLLPLPENDALIETARRLGLWGASAIQLKRDALTGEHKLLEWNPRFGGNIRMFIPVALRRGINPVLLAGLSNRTSNQSLGTYPAGDFGAAPGQELLAIELYLRAKLRRGAQPADNPPPTLRAFLGSYVETYGRRSTGIDPAFRGLLREPRAVLPMLLEVSRAIRGSGTPVDWQDVARHAIAGGQEERHGGTTGVGRPGTSPRS